MSHRWFSCFCWKPNCIQPTKLLSWTSRSFSASQMTLEGALNRSTSGQSFSRIFSSNLGGNSHFSWIRLHFSISTLCPPPPCPIIHCMDATKHFSFLKACAVIESGNGKQWIQLMDQLPVEWNVQHTRLFQNWSRRYKMLLCNCKNRRSCCS